MKQKKPKIVFLLTLFLLLGYSGYADTNTYTSVGEQNWTVPGGVSEVQIEVWGAEGGGGQGGIGGYAKGNLSVSGGDKLTIRVGGSQGTGDPYGSGGYNGGGARGEADPGDGGTSYWGKSGGGASDVRLNGNALADRVIVAGGGGGAGGFDYDNEDAGGDGGPANGQGGNSGGYAGPGGGGSQSGGGGGGSGYKGDNSGSVDRGGSGSLGNGGDGGDAHAFEDNYDALSGGGGGGGYYGGGGGGGQIALNGQNSAGGGGGSNYVGGVTDTTSSRGVDASNGGNGKVVITWEGNTAPNAPSNPNPNNGATGVTTSPSISADYSDPDGDSGTIEYYTGGDSLIGSCSVSDGGSCSVTYSSASSSCTSYNWYAVADDGAATNQSSTWSFTTGGCNNPPNAPSKPDPADGGTVSSTEATLNVDVSDPDGDIMDVSFYNGSDDSIIGTDSNVNSGGRASVTWSDLSTGNSHSWYAVADDGSATTQSSTWSFTTQSLAAKPDNFTVSMHLEADQFTVDGQTVSPGEYNPGFPYISTSNALGIVSQNPATVYASNLTADLKAYYLLNSNGNDAENGFDGSVNGASFSSGRINNAGDFDGNNDNVTLPKLGLFGDQSISVAAWINVDNGAPRKNNIFGFGQPGNTDQSFSLRTDNDGGFLFYFWGNDLGVSTDKYYGEWVHVAATYNSSTGERKIFFNGSLAGSDTTSSGNFQDENYIIGGYNNEDFNGKIDELRVYTRSLNQREVEHVMNHRNEEKSNTVFSTTSERQGFLLPFNQEIGFENIDGQESAIKNNNFMSRTSPRFERLTRNDPDPTVRVAYEFPYSVNSTFGDISNAESLQIRNVPFTPEVQLEISSD